MTSQYFMLYPVTNKHYSLNCWYCSVVHKKNLFQLMIFVSFSKKMYFPAVTVPTLFHLYLSNSLATVVSETDLYRLLIFCVPNLCVPFPLLRSYQRISPGPRHTYLFHNKASINVEELLAPCPTTSWRITPCRLSVTTYSIYSQLPSIWETVPSSATWGHAMPCHGDRPTYHGVLYPRHLKSRQFLHVIEAC